MPPNHELRDPSEDDDCELMCLVRGGDLAAFQLLVDRYRNKLQQFLYFRLGSNERAEDGAQEVFLRLWSTRARYQEKARFSTYLFVIARNYWRDEVRKCACRPLEVRFDLSERRQWIRHVGRNDPLEYLFTRYRQWRIRQSIVQLPEKYRLVFVLAHLQDQKLTEISEILDIPVGTVKSRLYTAVRMLRSALERDFEVRSECYEV